MEGKLKIGECALKDVNLTDYDVTQQTGWTTVANRNWEKVFFYNLIEILKHHGFSHWNIHLKVSDVIHVSQPANYPDSNTCEIIIRPVGLNSGVQQLRVWISTEAILVLYKRLEVSNNWACFPLTQEGQSEKKKNRRAMVGLLGLKLIFKGVHVRPKWEMGMFICIFYIFIYFIYYLCKAT